MAFVFDFTGVQPTTRQADHPNQAALGQSGAVQTSKGWRCSIVTPTEIIGTVAMPRPKGSRSHLHLGESEITGYHVAKHGGPGLVGRIVTDSTGLRHRIVSYTGGESWTAAESADFLSRFFPQYSDTDPHKVVARKDGTSKEGTGNIVGIHGEIVGAGAGNPVGDARLDTDNGGTIALQIKVLNHSTSTKAERLTHVGGQLLDSLVNEGRELMLMVARRDSEGYMTVAWYNVGSIVRMQADLCGDDLMSGEFPLSAPMGVPGSSFKVYGEDMTGNEVAGGGNMERGTSPFYLKYARGGTKTRRIAPRRPLTFSLAGLERFLSTLTPEQRARVESPAAPFDPTFLPAWSGECIF